MSLLAKYKKAVRAAAKYIDVPEAHEWLPAKEIRRIEKLEAKYDELHEKSLYILDELSPEDELKAIDWLAEEELYGFHDKVC